MDSMNKRKKVLFDLKVDDSKWIGGIYYLRNIIFQMTVNDNIRESYMPVVLCSERYKYLFERFTDNIEIYTYKDKLERLILSLKNTIGCKYIYNYSGYRFDPMNRLRSKAVFWIPDFQHKYFPEYFTQDDIARREYNCSQISDSDRPLVLSSKSCMDDFNLFSYKKRNKTYVIPFISCIDVDVRHLSVDLENSILERAGLDNTKYAVIMNQFWQHKNHIVVFKAIKKLFFSYPDCELYFVFTGKMEDYRNPNYIDQLIEIANDPLVAPHIKMLGFIDRTEQIAIMKNAAFVIQPSLFEGWGTVVEDAKVLDKTILLSDIPVHREQMNEKCIFFDPHDSAALAELINAEAQKEHHDDIEKGIEDMYARAREYSKGFEQLLKDLENKR